MRDESLNSIELVADEIVFESRIAGALPVDVWHPLFRKWNSLLQNACRELKSYRPRTSATFSQIKEELLAEWDELIEDLLRWDIEFEQVVDKGDVVVSYYFIETKIEKGEHLKLFDILILLYVSLTKLRDKVSHNDLSEFYDIIPLWPQKENIKIPNLEELNRAKQKIKFGNEKGESRNAFSKYVWIALIKYGEADISNRVEKLKSELNLPPYKSKSAFTRPYNAAYPWKEKLDKIKKYEGTDKYDYREIDFRKLKGKLPGLFRQGLEYAMSYFKNKNPEHYTTAQLYYLHLTKGYNEQKI